MKKSERGFAAAITLISVAVLILIGGGAYMFVRSNTQEERLQKQTEERLKTEIVRAQSVVVAQGEKLNEMKRQFRESYPLHAAVSEEYSKARQIIKNTDILFLHPETSKPDIIVPTKTSVIETDINARRAEITLLLNEWKQMADIVLAQTITEETVASVLDGAQEIAVYVEKLEAIVSALTPENSGLSQAEIDSYLTMVAQAERVVGTIITTLETVVEAETNATVQNENLATETPSVTIADIEAQETVVSQAAGQVTVLEEALANVQSQGSVPDPSLNTQGSGSQSATEAAASTTVSSTTSTSVSTTPIQEQPGKPRLIQYSNPF